METPPQKLNHTAPTTKLRVAIVEDQRDLRETLVDFFDASALAQQIIDLCHNPSDRARLGANARAFAIAHYDLEQHCLPKQMAWVHALAGSR